MRRSKWLLVTLVALVGIGFLAAEALAKCEPEKAATKYPNVAGKKIKVAVDPESPPYTFRDPKNFENIIGFDADLTRAVFKCTGLQFEFAAGGWSGLLPSVIAGQNDVMWSDLYYTAERARQVDYVVYMEAGTGGLVRKGNPKRIKSLEDACGMRAAAGLGTVEEAAFRDQGQKCTTAGKPAIQLVSYPDIAAGIRLIQNDRADLMMTDLGIVDRAAQENPAIFERGFKILSGFRIGAAVKKGNEDLLKAIYDGIQTIQSEGTQKKLLESNGVDPTLQVTAEILRK
jgi:polar amino acid transport system substrate-binding protein